MLSSLESLHKHNRDLLQLLTQNLPDMLWIKDIEGIYLYANQAICDGLLMAEDTQEPIGKNDIFFAQREREKYKENPQWHTFGELCFNSDLIVLKEKKAMRFEEYGNVKGKLLYLEVYKAPFFDEEGNILGTVGTGRDITTLKQTQLDLEENLLILKEQREQLQTLKNELEFKVQKELDKQQRQERLMLYQSRQAAMGEMLESIAHQWHQPLNNIALAASDLETKYLLEGLEEEEFRQKFDTINSNIKYMSNTIDDFRSFLYSEREVAAFEPKKIVENVLFILDAQLQSYNITCTIEQKESVSFFGVENEFKQVVLILLNNSIDAIKIELESARIKQGDITIKIATDESYSFVEVIDNGGGIDKSYLHQIFDPYFSTKKNSYGTGIGLYIAKKIIESGMGGVLLAKSFDTQSSFTVKIPNKTPDGA